MATFYMDVNGNTAGFHNAGGSLTASLIPTNGSLGISAAGTNVPASVSTTTSDELYFGSTSVASTTAGTLTLNSNFNMGSFLTRQLGGSASIAGSLVGPGTYLGQRITGANTLNLGAGTTAANLSGNSLFIDSLITMTGTLNITSTDAASVATPTQPSATGVNFSGTSTSGGASGTSGVTGVINVNSGFFKLVPFVNGHTFLASGTTVNIASGYTVMVQAWVAGLTASTINGTFAGAGLLRIQGDVTSQSMTFTGSLTGLTNGISVFSPGGGNANTVTTSTLPTAGTLFFESVGTNSSITTNASGSPTYLAGGIKFYSATGGTLNSSGSTGFTVSGGISNNSATAATLVLGGSATGNVISGNAASPGGGTLALTKANAGSWRLAGNNSAMAGAVTVTGGTIQAAQDTSLGSGAVTMSSGTSLELDGGFTFGNTLNAMGSIRSLAGATTVTSAITLVGATTIRADAGSLTFQSPTAWVGTNTNLTFNNAGDTGNITVGANLPGGTGTLTKNGASTLTLNGTASAFTGAVTLNGGTTQVSVLAASGSNSSIGAGSSVAFAGDALLLYTGSASVTFNRSLAFNSATAAGFQNSGTGTLVLNGAVSATSSTIVLAGSNTGFNRFETAIPAGANGFAKSGAGRWVVAGANNITGSSPITGGTLVAANATFTSKLVGSPVVGAGAKLQIAKESDGKARCTYGSLSMGGVVGTPARMRIGGIATSPTVLMSTTLYLPTAGPNMTWDLTGDTFKVPGTYTLVEFSGVGDAVGGSGGNVLAFVTPTVPTGRTYSNFQYNSGASPKTITIQIS